ncbi:MAG: hypothetical protein HYS13_19690 [Planctomycetia bacterium]|nr:hypothetical protein [Planctomycetia bacterium]
MPAHAGIQLLREVADLFTSGPLREELLAFRPSKAVQRRARELLAKSDAGELTSDEERQLTQFEHVELLMRLVKARLRNRKPE